MIVQSYEVTTSAEARALSAIGVDHIGVLVGDGSFPREQTIEAAREILSEVHSGAKRCALSLSSDLTLIRSIVTALNPDILHLGATPDRLTIQDVLTLKQSFSALS